MTSIFLSYFLLLSCLSPAAAHHHQTANVIQKACKATRYPETCKAQISQWAHFGSRPSPTAIIHSAISLSAHNLNSAQSMLRDILASSSGNRNHTQAAETCLEVLGYSGIRASASTLALTRDRIKDARAWFTASLAYQYDCWGGLKYVNDTADIRKTMSFINDALIVSTSNALSMVVALDDIGTDPASWTPPRTERTGFWEKKSGSATGTGFQVFGSGLRVNATVCKAEGCDHATVQQAVEAAPENLENGNRYVIHIKEGVYHEIVRVGFKKKNLVFLGDGIGKTVITGSLSTGLQGITTFRTATVGVLGDGFMARGLTVKNTAGAKAHQAVAFRSDSDLSFISSCEFIGNQDTLYAHSLRHLYKSCIIHGNVDFIFGNAAAVFHNCTLLIRPRQSNPQNTDTNTVAAHGRTDPAQSTGFVFSGCVVKGTEEYMRVYRKIPGLHRSYLGRPWKEYSRIVFVGCVLEELISPAGWLQWEGEFGLKTLYFGEFGNTGLGANLSQRVSWSSLIPADHVNAYSAKSFLLGY
ncbi:hypothetical protein V2J09_021912 [Rumex salicifolius]